MATILTDYNFKIIFMNENDRILIEIFFKLLRSSVSSKPALVQG